jgi:hypothetical protein
MEEALRERQAPSQQPRRTGSAEQGIGAQGTERFPSETTPTGASSRVTSRYEVANFGPPLGNLPPSGLCTSEEDLRVLSAARSSAAPVAATPVHWGTSYQFPVHQSLNLPLGLSAGHGSFMQPSVRGALGGQATTPVMFPAPSIPAVDALGRLWLPYVQSPLPESGTSSSVGFYADPRRYYRILKRRERRLLQWMRIRGVQGPSSGRFQGPSAMVSIMMAQGSFEELKRPRRRHESRRAHALRRRRDESGRFLSGPSTNIGAGPLREAVSKQQHEDERSEK